MDVRKKQFGCSEPSHIIVAPKAQLIWFTPMTNLELVKADVFL